MSRPKINPALAALDAEIAKAHDALAGFHRQVNEQAAIVTALEGARGRIAEAGSPAAPSSPRAARGSIEKAISKTLSAGPGQVYTAEQIRLATGQNPASLRKALARMVEAKAVVLVEDRYSLAAVAEQDAAQ